MVAHIFQNGDKAYIIDNVKHIYRKSKLYHTIQTLIPQNFSYKHLSVSMYKVYHSVNVENCHNVKVIHIFYQNW